MTLNACVRRADIVGMSRTKDICSGRVRCMFTSRPVTTLTTYIPFGYPLGVNVVSDGMAAIARWPGWAFHIVGRVILRPPIRPGADEIFAPNMILNFPLSRQRIVVVADLGEVTLLPNTAVNEGDLV